MRISGRALFGVSLIASVVANPLGVVVVENVGFEAAVRIGHAGANAARPPAIPMIELDMDRPVAAIPMRPEDEYPQVTPFKMVAADEACEEETSLRRAFQRLSDYFREVIGLPALASYSSCSKLVPIPMEPIPCHTGDTPEVDQPHHNHGPVAKEGPVNILPFPWAPGPAVHVHSIPPTPRLRNPSMWLHRSRPTTFSSRLQKALYTLSPWEGRALAFVVGCGIGVLLRMFYVFAILAVRAFRVRKQAKMHREATMNEVEEDADKEPLLEPVYNEKE